MFVAAPSRSLIVAIAIDGACFVSVLGSIVVTELISAWPKGRSIWMAAAQFPSESLIEEGDALPREADCSR